MLLLSLGFFCFCDGLVPKRGLDVACLTGDCSGGGDPSTAGMREDAEVAHATSPLEAKGGAAPHTVAPFSSFSLAEVVTVAMNALQHARQPAASGAGPVVIQSAVGPFVIFLIILVVIVLLGTTFPPLRRAAWDPLAPRHEREFAFSMNKIFVQNGLLVVVGYLAYAMCLCAVTGRRMSQFAISDMQLMEVAGAWLSLITLSGFLSLPQFTVLITNRHHAWSMAQLDHDELAEEKLLLGGLANIPMWGFKGFVQVLLSLMVTAGVGETFSCIVIILPVGFLFAVVIGNTDNAFNPNVALYVQYFARFRRILRSSLGFGLAFVLNEMFKDLAGHLYTLTWWRLVYSILVLCYAVLVNEVYARYFLDEDSESESILDATGRIFRAFLRHFNSSLVAWASYDLMMKLKSNAWNAAVSGGPGGELSASWAVWGADVSYTCSLILMIPFAGAAMNELEMKAIDGSRRAHYTVSLLTYQLGLMLAWSLIEMFNYLDKFFGVINKETNPYVNTIVCGFEFLLLSTVAMIFAVRITRWSIAAGNRRKLLEENFVVHDRKDLPEMWPPGLEAESGVDDTTNLTSAQYSDAEDFPGVAR